VVEQLDQLRRGAQEIMHRAAIMDERTNKLEEANDAVTRRKRRQKKRIQRGGALTVAEGAALVTQIHVDAQIYGESRQGGEALDGNAQ
jgi:hypothetical protein